MVGVPGRSAGMLRLRPFKSSAVSVGKTSSAYAIGVSKMSISVAKIRTMGSPRLSNLCKGCSPPSPHWITCNLLKGLAHLPQITKRRPMYITTLLCKPGQQALTPALTQSLLGAWGGRALTWLAAMEAVEFEILTLPENLWQVWGDMQELGIDLIVQPVAGRRKKMLLADMDSTMIEQECIDELAAEAGVGPRVAQITARAMNGKLDFEQALRERVGLLKGLNTKIIQQVYQNRITFMPGGAVLLATMQAQGGYAALVSGGFTDFTHPVAQHLGFNTHRANSLLQADGALTGEVGLPILGREAKVTALQEISATQGLNPEDVLAVGDGANDLGMLQLAGTGVALHAKPIVQEQVSVRVNHGDLTALLYLQGYTKTQFVTPENVSSAP